jgi:hypothetical protein
MDFLWETKIHSKTSFEGEVKTLATCCEILQHVKKPCGYERDISSAKFTATSHQVSPYSLIVVSAGICQRGLVNESGIIKELRWGYTIDQKVVAEHGTLCTIPSHNSNQ